MIFRDRMLSLLAFVPIFAALYICGTDVFFPTSIKLILGLNDYIYLMLKDIRRLFGSMFYIFLVLSAYIYIGRHLKGSPRFNGSVIVTVGILAISYGTYRSIYLISPEIYAGSYAKIRLDLFYEVESYFVVAFSAIYFGIVRIIIPKDQAVTFDYLFNLRFDFVIIAILIFPLIVAPIGDLHRMASGPEIVVKTCIGDENRTIRMIGYFDKDIAFYDNGQVNFVTYDCLKQTTSPQDHVRLTK